jgi:hypothetical protein
VAIAPFINTGLEAGDMEDFRAAAVLTAFFFLPPQAMAIDEFFEFLSECAYAMVLLLSCNVCRDLIHI